jgi:ABC-type sugar transport system ATPase subunit
VVDGLQGQSFGPVSFTLESGEVVGIAGAEGNGQPQLFDCLAGRVPAQGRRVVCEGKDLSLISTTEAVRAGIMLLPGDRKHGPDVGARGAGEHDDPVLRRFSLRAPPRRRSGGRSPD